MYAHFSNKVAWVSCFIAFANCQKRCVAPGVSLLRKTGTNDPLIIYWRRFTAQSSGVASSPILLVCSSTRWSLLYVDEVIGWTNVGQNNSLGSYTVSPGKLFGARGQGTVVLWILFSGKKISCPWSSYSTYSLVPPVSFHLFPAPSPLEYHLPC